MAECITIQVEPRDAVKNKGTGSRVARRLRARGLIPAIVYGHKQTNLPVAVSRDQVWSLIKKGSHLAQLQIGNGGSEMVLVRDVQWDHLGKEIIHLDFVRVSANERVTTEVPLVLHGTPVGLSEGGALEQPIHSLEITAEVTAIPDQIRVDVDHLHLHQMIYVRDLKLPPGVTAVSDPDQVVVHVAAKKSAAEPTTVAETAAAEPELIGRKEKKEEEAESKK
ncbi:MAG: 50S ribosomal protein L25 [Isosphaeraceae bacterium]|jgi:large subunit ribosomal protein L25|nr:MAG: 50S ribosomal protein L25 [Isosphaeraceae bacterium]